MYATVNVLISERLFITLQYVHECQQLDKIKHRLNIA